MYIEETLASHKVGYFIQTEHGNFHLYDIVDIHDFFWWLNM